MRVKNSRRAARLRRPVKMSIRLAMPDPAAGVAQDQVGPSISQAPDASGTEHKRRSHSSTPVFLDSDTERDHGCGKI
jgi:hypothetical protein